MHDLIGCYNINVAAVSSTNHKATAGPLHHFHCFLYHAARTNRGQRVRRLRLDLHCLLSLQYLFTQEVRNTDQYWTPAEAHCPNHSNCKFGHLVWPQYSQLSQISGPIGAIKRSLDVQMVAV